MGNTYRVPNCVDCGLPEWVHLDSMHNFIPTPEGDAYPPDIIRYGDEDGAYPFDQPTPYKVVDNEDIKAAYKAIAEAMKQLTGHLSDMAHKATHLGEGINQAFEKALEGYNTTFDMYYDADGPYAAKIVNAHGEYIHHFNLDTTWASPATSDPIGDVRKMAQDYRRRGS